MKGAGKITHYQNISEKNVKKVFPTWKHVFQLGRVINKAIIPLYDALKHDWNNTKKINWLLERSWENYTLLKNHMRLLVQLLGALGAN